MAKALLKFMMLRILSEGEATGYELIKEIGSLTGHKPSTGSVYPLLKSMQSDGWIEGQEQDEKTVYKITKLGKGKFSEFDKAHSDYVVKMHQSISVQMADHPDLGHVTHMDILSHFVHAATELIDDDSDSDEIEKVLSKALDDLKKLKGGESDD